MRLLPRLRNGSRATIRFGISPSALSKRATFRWRFSLRQVRSSSSGNLSPLRDSRVSGAVLRGLAGYLLYPRQRLRHRRLLPGRMNSTSCWPRPLHRKSPSKPARFRSRRSLFNRFLRCRSGIGLSTNLRPTHPLRSPRGFSDKYRRRRLASILYRRKYRYR